LPGPPPQLTIRITQQFSLMTRAQQLSRETHYLGLATPEIAFWVNSAYAHALCAGGSSNLPRDQLDGMD
jgi:hypothetical protein